MKTTRYFDEIRKRAERAAIRDEWGARVIAAPEQERKQTVHNAFFDRGFKP